MRNFYITYNFFLRYKFLIKYYTILYYTIMNGFVSGFMSKSSSIYVIINVYMLHFVLFFMKFNMLSGLRMLTDIVAVDNPNSVNNRFELTYSFWNINFNFRVYVKLFLNMTSPIMSISSLYNSSS